MRRMREDHLHRNYSDVNERPIRCRAKLIQPKAGMAARLAMIPSAYNGTSCPATATSNGGSSERSSEGLDSRWALPGAGSFNRPTVREVVSNRTEQKNLKNIMRAAPYPGIAICFQPRQERPSFFISELRGAFSTMHSPRLYDLHELPSCPLAPVTKIVFILSYSSNFSSPFISSRYFSARSARNELICLIPSIVSGLISFPCIFSIRKP